MAVDSEKIQEILEDAQKMTKAGRQLLREDPLEYAASRNRLLRAGLLNGDGEQVDMIVDEVSAVIGRGNAQMWKINTMGEIVRQQLEEAEKSSQ